MESPQYKAKLMFELNILLILYIRIIIGLYSETPLNRTPLGQMKMFALEGFSD